MLLNSKGQQVVYNCSMQTSINTCHSQLQHVLTSIHALLTFYKWNPNNKSNKKIKILIKKLCFAKSRSPYIIWKGKVCTCMFMGSKKEKLMNL